MKRERRARILELNLGRAERQRGQPAFPKSRFRTRWQFPPPPIRSSCHSVYISIYGKWRRRRSEKSARKLPINDVTVVILKLTMLTTHLFKLAASSTHKRAVCRFHAGWIFYIARLKWPNSEGSGRIFNINEQSRKKNKTHKLAYS